MRYKIITLVTIAALMFAEKSEAQNFTTTYDFGGVNSNSGREDPTPVPEADGLLFGSFKAVAPTGNPFGLSANPNASGRFSFTGWPGGATNNSDVFTGSISTEQYYEVTISPETYYSLQLDSVLFSIQRSGTGIRQYAVRYSIDGFATNLAASISPANANLKVVPDNIFQITDATTTAQNGNKITFGAATVTAPVTLRFYGWNAESNGTFSIDNVIFYGSRTISPTAPVIAIDPKTITFPATVINTNSAPLTYKLQGDNLSGPITVQVNAPFSVSSTPGGSFTNALEITAATASGNPTIYVQFSPTAAVSYVDTIKHNSTSATVKKLVVNGEGINPDNFVFNFNNCLDGEVPGSGFTSYSVTGAQKWSCTAFGYNSTNGVSMNGFSGGNQLNDDWLISPPLSLGAVNLPVLRFWSRGEFIGPPLQLLISTDYDGSSDPTLATWTDLEAYFPLANNTWALTDGIDLSAYKAFPRVFIAFRYQSSEELGAARWNIDEVDITNRSQLLTVNPPAIDFGEASAGQHSAPVPFTIKAVGYGDVMLTAPDGFELSNNNINFASTTTITAAAAAEGTTLYARFSPASKQLIVNGLLNVKGSGLDSNGVAFSGTSYPRAETFDVGTYNLSFFGSNPTNNPTQEKINTQVANIAKVLQKMNLDVVGIEEVSNDKALDSLVVKLPNRKAVLSNRWSYSFNAPDPSFPPQKVGFIYDTTSMKLKSTRVMFTSLYDSARGSYPSKLPNYPGGAVSFWAGGRLPFMATFDATINGVMQQVHVIVLHAKSSTDAASYNRRVYDARVLYDTLQAYYSNEPVVIVGDYNDRLFGSTYTSGVSPFNSFVTNNAQYIPLTLPLDQAGKISYIGGSALIDHIIATDELQAAYISNSTIIEDPRSYIGGYGATSASDHFPVYARFNFTGSLPVTLLNFNAEQRGNQVRLSWATANEFNNKEFIVERSGDNRNFLEIVRKAGFGNSSIISQYESIDASPLKGINYYRLKQTDIDGHFTYSNIVALDFSKNVPEKFSVYPNPVTDIINIKSLSASGRFTAKVSGMNGRLVALAFGTIQEISRELTGKLDKMTPGVYTMEISNTTSKSITSFVKQ